jgi:hypothetical protein
MCTHRLSRRLGTLTGMRSRADSQKSSATVSVDNITSSCGDQHQ